MVQLLCRIFGRWHYYHFGLQVDLRRYRSFRPSYN